jgi:sequestosome 1
VCFKFVELVEMSTENVSFKVHFKPDDAAGEVRRFTVERNLSSSLTHLMEKLYTVFPELRRRPFAITWQDSDGDHVTIGSDDELAIALAEMQGPVYKLTVSLKAGGTSRQQNSDQGELHPNVTCDGCEKAVFGNRFKCLVCDDYDLCGNCEAVGRHPGHSMVRLVRPADAAWTAQILRNMRRRLLQEGSRVPVAGDAGQQMGWMGGQGFGGHRHRGGPRRGFGCRNSGGWAPVFDALVQGWTGGSNTAPGTADEEARSAGHDAAHATAHASAISAAQAAHDAAVKAAAAARSASAASAAAPVTGADYLRNVGDFVAAALDPFGIDVLVEIENALGERQKVGVNSAANTDASSSTNSNVTAAPEPEKEKTPEEQEKTPELPAATETTQPEASAPVVEPEKSKSPTPSEGEDSEWTMVPNGKKEKQAENKTVEIPIQVSESPVRPLPETPRVLYVDPAGTMYPKLPAVEPTPAAATSAPAAAQHADPRIQVALQAMLNMGFTNEGGWLATLLEAKNGDIGKVLDVLQPVKK